MGFILNEHGDFAKPGIEAIAEGYVDDTVFACKRDCRFGAVLGEREEPFAAATGKDYGKDIAHGHDLFRGRCCSDVWLENPNPKSGKSIGKSIDGVDDEGRQKTISPPGERKGNCHANQSFDQFFAHFGDELQSTIQELLNGRGNILRFGRWGEAVLDFPRLIHKKFGEVPFNGFRPH